VKPESKKLKQAISSLNELLENFDKLHEGSSFLQSEGVEWYDADDAFIDAVKSWDNSVEAILISSGKSDALQSWRISKQPSLNVINIHGYAERRRILLLEIKSKLELEYETDEGLAARTYESGGAYDLYRDLATIIQDAKSGIFVIDPYADEEVFELYFAKCTKLNIRLLCQSPSQALRAVARKFSANKTVRFEARISGEIHDRLIFVDGAKCWILGQSLKDAATKKPTYLVEFNDASVMTHIYEDIWTRAKPF